MSATADVLNCREDVDCFYKISLKNVNFGIAVFQIFCIGAGLLAFNRELIYEIRENVQYLVVWNGNLPTYCRNITEPSIYPSLFTRFELEPYVKLGFKFALMYPATIRIFFSYCQYQVFQRQLPKNENKIFAFFYKLPPILLGAQIVFCIGMLLISFQMEYFNFPFYNFKLTECFMISTGMYFIFCMIVDLRRCAGLVKFLQTPIYLIRFLSALIFACTSVPTVSHLWTTELPISCTHYADSSYFAAMEYLTVISIFLFHFTELFELQNVYLFVLEKKYKKDVCA